MSKPPVLIANVIGQTAAMIASPFFNGTSIKDAYFEGYRAIEDIFPDAVLAQVIAERLNKEVGQKILCEELHLVRSIVYYGENKTPIADFSGLEYVSNLEVIRLTHLMDLGSVPDTLQRLPRLKVIEVTHGQLTAIPEWVFQLPVVEKLNFSYQHITDLPTKVEKAKRLRSLQLTRNKISHLPSELWTLKQLQLLNIGGNPVEKISKDVVFLTKLQQLDISQTKVAKLPLNLAFLESLVYLNITGTPIKALDFLLQRRVQDKLHIEGENNDMRITTYPKREYVDEKRLFPGTMLMATAFSFFAVGAGVKCVQKKRQKEEL